MTDSKVSKNRIIELDSLRGLAAFSVFLSHGMGMLTFSGVFLKINTSFLRTFWDGAAAVVLFFVLSGFVLSLPYIDEKGKRLNVIQYIIRRFFRIYPAYFIAIMFSLILKYFLFKPGGLYGLSTWVNSLWKTPQTSISEIIKHIIMAGLNTHEIDPVVWSLVIELKVSLIFPVFIFIIKKFKSYRICLIFLFILFLLGYFLDSIYSTIPLFVMGGLIAKYNTSLVKFVERQSKWIKYSYLILGFFLYGFRYTFFGLIKNETFLNYVVGLGTSIIIIIILSSNKIKLLLSLKPIKFLGDISYSFYLLHLPILLTCSSLLYSKTKSIILTWLVSLFLSLLISLFMYKFIEKPFQKVGKNVATLLISKLRYQKEKNEVKKLHVR